MSTSKILELLGLALNVLGAILLTYDLFYGRANRWWAEIHRDRLNRLRQSRKDLLDVTMAHPTLTAEAKEKIVAEDEAKYHFAESEAKILADLKHAENQPERAQTIGLIGVLILILGFLSEFVGVALRREL